MALGMGGRWGGVLEPPVAPEPEPPPLLLLPASSWEWMPLCVPRGPNEKLNIGSRSVLPPLPPLPPLTGSE